MLTFSAAFSLLIEHMHELMNRKGAGCIGCISSSVRARLLSLVVDVSIRTQGPLKFKFTSFKNDGASASVYRQLEAVSLFVASCDRRKILTRQVLVRDVCVCGWRVSQGALEWVGVCLLLLLSFFSLNFGLCGVGGGFKTAAEQEDGEINTCCKRAKASGDS